MLRKRKAYLTRKARIFSLKTTQDSQYPIEFSPTILLETLSSSESLSVLENP